MTLPDRCPLCGGPVVVVWDFGKCAGFCGLKIDHIESMSATARARWIRSMNRQMRIANAKDVDVKGDIL